LTEQGQVNLKLSERIGYVWFICRSSLIVSMQASHDMAKTAAHRSVSVHVARHCRRSAIQDAVIRLRRPTVAAMRKGGEK
jgi:hypothetical protein